MDFTVNQIINKRYQLLSSIGFGTFGEVWLAKDIILDMNVAIKIYVALDSRGFNEFKQEFRTAYSLHHPNLLRADYFDSVDKNPYLIMPFCPESVGDKIGKMDENEIWRFIYDVSGGLIYLHEKDVIHRDIKPYNILQNEHGKYVITDFGLSTKMRSTLRKASARQNDTKNTVGTIGYMAPELFTASPQAVKATDIWAFGATVFEIITGELPFCGQGGVMETYGAELPDVPNLKSTSLLNLIHQCLAKDPWDRPTAYSIYAQAAKELGLPDVVNYETSKNELKYIKEIEKLNQEIRKLKGNVKVNRNKIFKPLFFVTLLVLCGSIIAYTFYNNSQKRDYEAKIDGINGRLSRAHNVINNIQGVIEKHALSNEEAFSDWTSSNHEDNSSGTCEYEFEASAGDKLSFDYDVDSESYDHFICNLVHNGNASKISDVSGLNRRGVVRHTIKDDGSYELKLLYKKDGTIRSGRDNARIYNIRLERCIEGKLKHILEEYINGNRNDTVKAHTFSIRTVEAERHGIVKGAYHFLRLGSSVDDQVHNFIETTHWNVGNLPPALDIEVESEIQSYGVEKRA